MAGKYCMRHHLDKQSWQRQLLYEIPFFLCRSRGGPLPTNFGKVGVRGMINMRIKFMEIKKTDNH